MRGAIDTVLLDLDGTLLDTADDMGGALNAVLVAEGHAPLPLETIRPHVSKGGMALVCLGFNITADDVNAERLWRMFLDCYRENLSVNTCLFPGMETLLTHIENSDRRWGIVTNKPTFLTEPLLHELQLSARSACIVCGDTLERRKPYPDQLLHACEVTRTDVGNAIYVGDDMRDIEAGRRAGMRTVAAAYGYVVPGEDAHAWGADAVVEHPDEILQWLD